MLLTVFNFFGIYLQKIQNNFKIQPVAKEPEAKRLVEGCWCRGCGFHTADAAVGATVLGQVSHQPGQGETAWVGGGQGVGAT